MPKVDLLISLDDDHLDKFSDVVERCKNAGLNVDQELKAVGVITGSADSSEISKIKKLKGVSNVEKSQEIKIPSPDSDIQ